MPDMERVIDDFKVTMADKGFDPNHKTGEYWDGYRKGKSRARIQIAIIAVVVAVIVVWLVNVMNEHEGKLIRQSSLSQNPLNNRLIIEVTENKELIHG